MVATISNNHRPALKVSRSTSWHRALDRWFGIPLVWLCGLLRKQRPLPFGELKKFVFVKSTAIGDTVLLSGALLSFREKYPFAHLTLVVGPSNFAIAQLLTGIDEIVCVPLTKPWLAWPILRRLSCDVWVDFGSWSRLEALTAWLANSKWTLGFATKGQWREGAFDQTVPHSLAAHESQNYRNLLRPLGVLGEVPPKLVLPAKLQELESAEKVQIVFHFWAGGSQALRKQWPEDNWRKLALWVQAHGLTVGLTGGPSNFDDNQLWIESFANVGMQNLAGVSLLKTCQILSQARAVVSVDTGVLHLASALGVPVLGLHGPTHSVRWGAVSRRSLSLNAVEDPQQAPIQYGFETEGDLSLMQKLTVEQVTRALEQLIQNANAKP